MDIHDLVLEMLSQIFKKCHVFEISSCCFMYFQFVTPTIAKYSQMCTVFTRFYSSDRHLVSSSARGCTHCAAHVVFSGVHPGGALRLPEMRAPGKSL